MLLHTNTVYVKKYYINKQCNLIETENYVQIIIFINVTIILIHLNMCILLMCSLFLNFELSFIYKI